MSDSTSRREPLRAFTSELAPEERRGWLSHGLAALAISALGLAVAGSVALTTHAETTDTQTTTARATEVLITVPKSPAQTNRTEEATGKDQPALSAFERRGSAGSDITRDKVRAARVQEQAAERATTLNKTQENVAKSSQMANSSARDKDLAKAEREIRANQLRMAEEKRLRAEAARLAAEAAAKDAAARDAAAAKASATTTSTRAGTTPQIDTGAISTSGGGVAPVAGAIVGAPFGAVGSWSRYHTGIDFRASLGTPIRAVKPGVVMFAGNTGDWAGNHVEIQHAGGLTTQSSHMSAMTVSNGQSVQAGQVIGYVGLTGRTFGPHLHFELYPAGVKAGDVYRAIDPEGWLSASGVQTR